jgi:uncharacterized RDD family membrane protein YckC
MTDQRPRPAALIPATIGRRVGAYAVDLVIAFLIPLVLWVIGLVVFFAVGRSWTERSLAVAILIAYLVIGAISLAWAIVYTAMQGGRGSIGQRALGLQLHDATTGAPIGFWRALGRNLIWALAGSIVVGYFSPLFDSSGRRQGWHDQVARAVVVDRKAMDAAASAVVPAAPAPRANPYLPPPAGQPAAPVAAPGTRFPSSAPAAPVAPAQPAPGARFAPAPPAPGGVISMVPGVTSDPAEVRSVARASDDAVASAPGQPVAPPPYTPPAASAPPPYTPPAAAPVPPPYTPPVAAPAPVAEPVEASSPTSLAPTTDEFDIDATRAGAPVARAIASLAWDDGTTIAVFGRTLFGRNPAQEDGATAIAVRDETLSLSKTHFEVDGDASGVWVIDRHSTNGTILVRGGLRQQLGAGARMPLRSGDRLEFGDRSVTVGGTA